MIASSQKGELAKKYLYAATVEYSASTKKKKNEEFLYLIKWNNNPDIVKIVKQHTEKFMYYDATYFLKNKGIEYIIQMYVCSNVHKITQKERQTVINIGGLQGS